MIKFTAQDVINVYLMGWMTVEFLEHCRPVPIAGKFKGEGWQGN